MERRRPPRWGPARCWRARIRSRSRLKQRARGPSCRWLGLACRAEAWSPDDRSSPCSPPYVPVRPPLSGVMGGRRSIHVRTAALRQERRERRRPPRGSPCRRGRTRPGARCRRHTAPSPRARPTCIPGSAHRDVVGVDELRRRSTHELAKTDGEDRRPQRVLQRLPGHQVGRERHGPRPPRRRGSAPRPKANALRGSRTVGRHRPILVPIITARHSGVQRPEAHSRMPRSVRTARRSAKDKLR